MRLLQANVTIVDVGRAAEGCAAHLVVGSATQCATVTARLGTADGIGAQKWVLTDVPGSDGLVYISNEVTVGEGRLFGRN